MENPHKAQIIWPSYTYAHKTWNPSHLLDQPYLFYILFLQNFLQCIFKILVKIQLQRFPSPSSYPCFTGIHSFLFFNHCYIYAYWITYKYNLLRPLRVTCMYMFLEWSDGAFSWGRLISLSQQLLIACASSSRVAALWNFPHLCWNVNWYWNCPVLV